MHLFFFEKNLSNHSLLLLRVTKIYQIQSIAEAVSTRIEFINKVESLITN